MPRFVNDARSGGKSLFGLVRALGGDQHSGRCRCPAHNGNSATSLKVDEAAGLAYCHAGCSFEEVLSAAEAHGWRRGSDFIPTNIPPVKSKAQRRAWALEILREVDGIGGYARAQQVLPAYFARRGINTVPPTAMLAVSCKTLHGDPAMVFEIVIDDGLESLGCQVTWLAPCKTRKRDADPQRQFFAPIKGGYIKLYEGELDPSAKLVIGEGVESALSAAQIMGGVPAIAALNAGNLPKITPPLASEYIIAADNDPPGLDGARALKINLTRAGHKVWLAIPPRKGSDWNDFILYPDSARIRRPPLPNGAIRILPNG